MDLKRRVCNKSSKISDLCWVRNQMLNLNGIKFSDALILIKMENSALRSF